MLNDRPHQDDDRHDGHADPARRDIDPFADTDPFADSWPGASADPFSDAAPDDSVDSFAVPAPGFLVTVPGHVADEDLDAASSGSGAGSAGDGRASGSAAVTLVGDVLEVRGLLVADPAVVGGARRASAAATSRAASACGPAGSPLAASGGGVYRDAVPGALGAWVAAALGVGARALAVADGASAVEELSRTVDRVAGRAVASVDAGAERVAAAVTEATRPGDGLVAVSVRQALDGLAGRLDGLLVGEDAPVRSAVARAVAQVADQAAGRVERALAVNADAVRRALADPAGPVQAACGELLRQSARDRADLTAQLAAVRDLLVAADAGRRVMARTAVKGATYEQAVVAALVDAAEPGDLVEATGTAAGATGGRQGDAVVAVAPAISRGLSGVCVVVEAKDAVVSPAGLARALDEAAANRRAQAALAVVRAARMPGSAGVLVLGPGRLAVGWEPGEDSSMLRAALHLVRAAAVEQAVADALPGLDRAVLVDALRRATAALDEWSRLARALGAARRALDDLEATASRVRDRVAAALAAGSRALEAAQ